MCGERCTGGRFERVLVCFGCDVQMGGGGIRL